MLTTHAAGSATAPLIASCSFVFRVVGFIIDDLKKKKRLCRVEVGPRPFFSLLVESCSLRHREPIVLFALGPVAQGASNVDEKSVRNIMYLFH